VRRNYFNPEYSSEIGKLPIKHNIEDRGNQLKPDTCLPKKALLPPLHIKLSLMKQFVKALPKEGECFKYLCDQFPGLPEAKLKEGVFVGPDIRKMMKDENFELKIEKNERKTWKSFNLVITSFLGNKKYPNYKSIIEEMIKKFQDFKL
ncbi:hypothetical protein AVEN_35913-1, partial [Araneus ventricosus]